MNGRPICPKCESDKSYHNGINFVCMDCLFHWPEYFEIDEYEENYSEFKEQNKLNEPYFKLEHGKLYDCIFHHEKGNEEISIIPLAFKIGKNLQFIMKYARILFNNNQSLVQEIIKMDFDYIYNDGIRFDYPFEYSAYTILCATQEDGSIIDYSDNVYLDFIKTNEV
jgi:hypothetical protein